MGSMPSAWGDLNLNNQKRMVTIPAAEREQPVESSNVVFADILQAEFDKKK